MINIKLPFGYCILPCNNYYPEETKILERCYLFEKQLNLLENRFSEQEEFNDFTSISFKNLMLRQVSQAIKPINMSRQISDGLSSTPIMQRLKTVSVIPKINNQINTNNNNSPPFVMSQIPNLLRISTSNPTINYNTKLDSIDNILYSNCPFTNNELNYLSPPRLNHFSQSNV